MIIGLKFISRLRYLRLLESQIFTVYACSVYTIYYSSNGKPDLHQLSILSWFMIHRPLCIPLIIHLGCSMMAQQLIKAWYKIANTLCMLWAVCLLYHRQRN